MTLHHRQSFWLLLAGTASLLLVPATGRAQLVPPGDYRGTSLDEWGLDYLEWALATGLGEQTLPDTVDGVRYLPPNFGGGDFVASLTIDKSTAVISEPFSVFGEKYDNGTEDNPADPFIDTIFDETTIKVTYDGSVVLEGIAGNLTDRLFGVTVFPDPIPYAEPQPRGPGLNSIAAIFGVGVVTIFDPLPIGAHTIKNEFNSSVFGAASYTYNITVVPEPGTLLLAGMMVLCSISCARRRESK
ncbi:MAG: hypothetical protein AB7G28_11780 [Pirellulales bacterium]